MRLWGKVVSGSLLVFAAVFVGVGLFVPEARGACLVAAAACTAVALLGVPLVVRAFMSFTGDEDVLEHGLPETATSSPPPISKRAPAFSMLCAI